MKLNLREKTYEIEKLSGLEMLNCVGEYKKTLSKLSFDEEDEELASSLAEYGALVAFALKTDGRRNFESGLSALKELTVDELCLVYDCYKAVCAEREAGR